MKIGYADNWNSTGNPSTYAYPTIITDPANNSSTVKYRYDVGSNVWAQSPAPAGQSIGKTTERLFDTIGRLSRETIVNSGAYTRYEYPTNGVQSKVFSTLVDIDNDGADADDEVLAESWSDGAGRTRMSRTEHPGSTGGWSGQIVEYDILGRTTRTSVPTEIDSSWDPDGDDAVRGWIWNSLEYDWMGRVIRNVNTDGTDRLTSYEGCGCAGSMITKVEGENIIETDWEGLNPTTLGRKAQKTYTDILGRVNKIESLNWNGSIYSSTESTFNALDQTVSSVQTEVATSTSQTTTMTYDGLGRLKTRHIPQQDDMAATTYNYNVDDSIASVTDARGSTTHYEYNVLGLVQEIDWSVPQLSEIFEPDPVTFTYDNIGNRLSMQDGQGVTTYTSNELSQIISETRNFDDLTNNYTLQYTYTLSGQLKSLTNPGGTIVTYDYDKNGRLTDVNGTGFAHRSSTWQGSTPISTYNAITEIARSIQYRAWGDIKHAEFQDGRQYDITYDDRLRPYEYIMPGKLEKRYTYLSDNSLRYVKDLLDFRSDRLFSYDNMGRITKAYGGHMTRSPSFTPYLPHGEAFVPVKNDYTYNAFNNPVIKTEAFSRLYIRNMQYQHHDVDMQRVYVNNRAEEGVRPYESDWLYDADGRFVEDLATTGTKIKYDAFGRTDKILANNGEVFDEKTISYDGDGNPSKDSMHVLMYMHDEEGTPLPPFENTSSSFYLRSTVLGGAIIAFVNEWDIIGHTNIYANGTIIAKYSYISSSSSTFKWEHTDSNRISGYTSTYDSRQYSSAFPNEDLTLPGKNEFHSNGEKISRLPHISELHGAGWGNSGFPAGPETGGGSWDNFNCVLDGVTIPCGWLSNYSSQNGGTPVYTTPPNQAASIWYNETHRFSGIDGWNTQTDEQGLALSRSSQGWSPSPFSSTGSNDCDNILIPCPIVSNVFVQIPEDDVPIIKNDIQIGFRINEKPIIETPAKPLTIGEAIQDGQLKGRWGWSKDALRKVTDCIAPHTADYLQKVDELNEDAMAEWKFNSGMFIASSLGLPTSIGAVKDALNEPGAKYKYGWKQKTLTMSYHNSNGKVIKEVHKFPQRSIPGNRAFFWATFTFQAGLYIHVQGSANETNAEKFGLYTKLYGLQRNECIRSLPPDIFVIDQ